MENYFKYNNPRLLYRKEDQNFVGDEGVIREVWVTKHYDKNLSSKLGVIVDIGAHIGSFTIRAALLAPNAKIYAYEPVTDNFELLRSNVIGNNLGDRVSAFNLGIAGSAGDRQILRDDTSSTGGASMYWGDKDRVVNTVKCITLQDIFTDNNITTIDFLKVDCEGAEFDIFENSVGILSSIQNISMEVHPSNTKAKVLRDAFSLEKLLRENKFIIELSGGNHFYHLEAWRKK